MSYQMCLKGGWEAGSGGGVVVKGLLNNAELVNWGIP